MQAGIWSESRVFVSRLSVFAGGPTGLALKTVFRLLLRGYTRDYRTHGGREEGRAEEGLVRAKTDGLMDRWICVQLKKNVLAR